MGYRPASAQRPPGWPLLTVAGNQSEAISQQQQCEDRDRQANAYGQGLYGAVAGTAIPIEKEQTGKQTSNHGNQHEHDDELEHRQLQ